jgi:hypothetical protein
MVRLKEAVPSSLSIHIYTGGDSLDPVLGTCSRGHNPRDYLTIPHPVS